MQQIGDVGATGCQRLNGVVPACHDNRNPRPIAAAIAATLADDADRNCTAQIAVAKTAVPVHYRYEIAKAHILQPGGGQGGRIRSLEVESAILAAKASAGARQRARD